MEIWWPVWAGKNNFEILQTPLRALAHSTTSSVFVCVFIVHEDTHDNVKILETFKPLVYSLCLLFQCEHENSWTDTGSMFSFTFFLFHTLCNLSNTNCPSSNITKVQVDYISWDNLNFLCWKITQKFHELICNMYIFSHQAFSHWLCFDKS